MLAASSNITNANVVLPGGMVGFHTPSSLMEQSMLMHSLQSSSPAARIRAMNSASMIPPPYLLPNQRLQQPWTMNNVNIAVELLRRQQQQQQGL
jgi:hypothetical protein